MGLTAIKTYDEGKGSYVQAGWYHEEQKTYYRDVKTNHFMRKFQGWGIQQDIIDSLPLMGCERVLIRVLDSGSRFQAPLNTWQTAGVADNFGHGVQVFLDINHMEKTGGSAPLKPLTASAA
jgi:hypothetical protein